MTTINLAAFRNPGESDNAAFNRAMLDTSPTLEIYFPAGQGQTGGAYEITTTYWVVPGVTPTQGNITRSNVTLSGDGMYQSVIKQPLGSEIMLMSHADPSNPTNVRSDITIRDIMLDGNFSASVSQPGYTYNEHNHLVRIAGVTNFTALRVFFRDFMGDGLNLSSPLQSLVPKNTNLVVDACRFEGINSNKGRNGISILDCATWSVTGSAFVNVGDGTRPNPGPGAIDIEPEVASSVVTNGTVYNCSFDTLGRNAVALLNGVGATTDHVNVTYCSVRNAGFGIVQTLGYSYVLASDNYAENLGEIARFEVSHHITFQNTTVRTGQMIRFGDVQDVTIQNNGLVNCGLGSGVVFLQSSNILRVDVLNNQLYDCGIGGFSPMYFVQNQGIDVLNLNVKGNVINLVSQPLLISDIGRVVGGYDFTNYAKYNYVDRTGNSPGSISGGVENLINRP